MVDNRRLFRALIGKRSSQTVQKHFLDVVIEMTRKELGDSGIRGAHFETTVQYLAGALFRLVIWWIDERKPITPAELVATFQRLSRSVVATARALK